MVDAGGAVVSMRVASFDTTGGDVFVCGGIANAGGGGAVVIIEGFGRPAPGEVDESSGGKSNSTLSFLFAVLGTGAA